MSVPEVLAVFFFSLFIGTNMKEIGTKRFARTSEPLE
jgi:hypothetical protein